MNYGHKFNSENYIRSIMELFPMPCFYKDRKGLYQDCNSLFASKILGLEKRNIINRGIRDFFAEIPQDLANKYISQDNRLFEEDGLQVYESLVLCSDGNRHSFRFIKSCVKNEEGEVVGLFGYMVDLDHYIDSTDQYQQDKNIIELGKKASTIIHEIVNPMMSIEANYRKILRLSKNIDHPEIELVVNEAKKGLKSLDYMKDITRWVREMSYSSESGELVIDEGEEFKFHSIEEIIRQALDVMKGQILSSGIELNIPNLDTLKNLKLKCRKTQIIQAIINILKNSKDAVKDLDTKWITLSVDLSDNEIHIKIVDSGQGIPVEISSKIFEGGHTTKKRGEGSGIGLNLCRNILEAHYGKIFIDNKNPNTAFVITLPFIDE